MWKRNPDAKYGGTLSTLKPDEKEGRFYEVLIYKEHMQLVLIQGILFDDSKGLLEGKGKFRRYFNETNSDDINTRALVELIKQAAKLSRETFSVKELKAKASHFRALHESTDTLCSALCLRCAECETA